MLKQTGQQTCNIRIPNETHKLVKDHCRRDGRLIGAFVNKILIETIKRIEKSNSGNENDGQNNYYTL